MAKGITVVIPESWVEGRPKDAPGLPPGAAFSTWEPKDPKVDGPVNLVIIDFTTDKPADPKGTILSTYKGSPGNTVKGRPKALAEPSCVAQGTASVCSVPVKDESNGSGVDRVMVFQGKRITQLDFIIPPDLADGLMPQLLEMAATVKVGG